MCRGGVRRGGACAGERTQGRGDEGTGGGGCAEAEQESAQRIRKECKTHISVVLTVTSGLDPHMIN